MREPTDAELDAIIRETKARLNRERAEANRQQGEAIMRLLKREKEQGNE